MSNRRTILLIDATQQVRFIIGSVFLSILLMNCLVLAAFLLKPALLEFLEVRHTATLAGLEILLIAAMAYLSLILSHKISGPAYAIARDLKRLAGGDLTVRTTLRTGDLNSALADALNLTAESLCERIKALKSAMALLQEGAISDGGTRTAIEHALNELAYFKTDPPADSGATPDHADPAPAGAIVGELGNPDSSR